VSVNLDEPKLNFPFVRKLIAGVALLALVAIMLGGLLAGARMITVVYRAFFIMILAKVVGFIVLKVLVNYEEINRGKN
jgi:hypothetical protein